MTEELVAPLAWRPEFATNVPIIDDQHRVLITMLNDAGTNLTDRSPIEDYARIVQGLLSYAGYHFQTEESLMAEHGFDTVKATEAASHIAEHRSFADKVVAVQAGLAAGQRITRADLINFLTNWLSDHILRVDKELGAYICSCAKGQ
jgi:hemerythrin